MVYDYECTVCGYKVEAILKVEFRDEYVGDTCQSCGDGCMMRVATSVPFVLGNKGTVGWADSGYADNTVGNTKEFKNNGIYVKGEE